MIYEIACQSTDVLIKNYKGVLTGTMMKFIDLDIAHIRLNSHA